jgi:hypothetical protein
MSQEGRVDQGNVEAEVESLVDLGSVPMNLANQVEPTAAAMDRAPRHLKSKFFRGLLVMGIFLGACASPGEVTMPGPLGDDFALYDKGIPPVGEAYAQEEDNSEASSAEQSASAETKKPYAVEASIFWRFEATVQQDEGIVQALERAAQEKGMDFQPLANVPEGFVQVVEIRHGSEVLIYSWENILANNPIVYPGDKVTHTFVTAESLANLQRDSGLLVENIHIN